MKEEYMQQIVQLLKECDNVQILDIILKLLQKN